MRPLAVDFGFELQYLAVFFAAVVLSQALLFLVWLAVKAVRGAIARVRSGEGRAPDAGSGIDAAAGG